MQAGDDFEFLVVADRGASHPNVQRIDLPDYSATPTSLITLDALRRSGFEQVPAGWLVEASEPITPAQLAAARDVASDAGLTVEARDDQHSLSDLGLEATVVGIVLALGILAMTVGLIRSEAAGDLRTLTATGASSTVRRTTHGRHRRRARPPRRDSRHSRRVHRDDRLVSRRHRQPEPRARRSDRHHHLRAAVACRSGGLAPVRTRTDSDRPTCSRVRSLLAADAYGRDPTRPPPAPLSMSSVRLIGGTDDFSTLQRRLGGITPYSLGAPGARAARRAGGLGRPADRLR